jgi:hypothetical protein
VNEQAIRILQPTGELRERRITDGQDDHFCFQKEMQFGTLEGGFTRNEVREAIGTAGIVESKWNIARPKKFVELPGKIA